MSDSHVQRPAAFWPRRSFLKSCASAAAALALPAEAFAALAQVVRHRLPPDVLSLANPFVGTGARGHMFPGALAPFGLVQLSPDTSGPPDPVWNPQGDWYGWQHGPGYYYGDNLIHGFTHTHIQGAGGIDLGDILVMPMVEGKNWSWQEGELEKLTQMQIRNLGTDAGIVYAPQELGYRSFFSHARETAKPGYYSVHLDTPDVFAELTATTRCGVHRYRYPAHSGPKQGLMIDLAHGLRTQVYAAHLKIESPTRISGHRSTHGWAADRDIYFVMEFSAPAASFEVSVDGAISKAESGASFSGKEIRLILTNAPSTRTLTVRTGISPVSEEGAAANFKAELTGQTFDQVMLNTQKLWSDQLALFEADFTTLAEQQTFYSDLYHSLVAPTTYNDADGSYRGQDHKNYPNPGFTRYTTLSIWDIYRGEFPFLTLAEPARINDIIRTMLVDYEQLGLHSLPMWPLWGNETWSMIGFHAAAMIVGAYVRGFRDWDAEKAYAAIRDTALVGAESHGNARFQALFRKHGYVPSEEKGSVSCTLDLAYDYWCAGAMAQLLGKTEDAEMFFRLGQNYRNVFNPATGFMQAKSAAGKWREPFRPDQETNDYVETDAWQASFSVPHDVAGLIALCGGDEQFVAKLDGLFTAPSFVLDARPDITGMVGQNAQGNEPSNHHPYLFPFAGAAWKTQHWSRKVAALYNNTPAGIPGNDDCGQLASWNCFAALGFYPVNAATGVYILGSPTANRIALHNPHTKTKFTVIAENNAPDNVYIQRARLNGKDYDRSWITHTQITAGGDLHLTMGRTPNKDWASAPEHRPPSGLMTA